MRISNFEWDEWNINHIAKHSVTPQEVEEACYYQPRIFKTQYGRYLLLGQSQGGRYLAIVIEYYTRGFVRVVTARDMDQAERQKYIKGK